MLLPLTTKDKLRLPPQTSVTLPLRIYNPRGEAMTEVKIEASSEYPTVEFLSRTATIPKIDAGSVVDLSQQFTMRLTSGNGYFEPLRLQIKLTYDGWHEVQHDLDLLVIPEVLPKPAAVELLDGRTVTLKVFHQQGNQGGGKSIERTVTEGKGNGNGILEPGEEATVWVKMIQGMDPFDKNNWYRCKVYSTSPWIEEASDHPGVGSSVNGRGLRREPPCCGFHPRHLAAKRCPCCWTTNRGAFATRPTCAMVQSPCTRHFNCTPVIFTV